jgi:hypothetical protein
MSEPQTWLLGFPGVRGYTSVWHGVPLAAAMPAGSRSEAAFYMVGYDEVRKDFRCRTFFMKY